MAQSKLADLWDKMVDYQIATDEEIELVTLINGLTIESLNDIIYARTGYHSWEQFVESEGIEE